MKRVGTLNGIPIVEGNSNELKKNNILLNKSGDKISLYKRDDKGQVSNISGGSNEDSESSNKNNNVVYIKFNSSLDSLSAYISIVIIIRQFGLEKEKYQISESATLLGGGEVSEYWETILSYATLYCRGINNPINSSGSSFLNYNSLEEYEQLKGLDSNNRPFKIITKEEFDKDLTEEEARKIAAELSN